MIFRSHDFSESFSSCSKDESRYTGCFETIVFPTTIIELTEAVLHFSKRSEPFTIQGARTGISGSAVPHGGHVISTEKLNRISLVLENSASRYYLEVECGARLKDIIATSMPHGLEFKPNPTETNATIGGLFSTGSSGINSYRWGKTAKHVLSAEIITPQGEKLVIDRGKYFFDDYGCLLPNGSHIIIDKYPKLSGACSFTPFIGMDLLDLFAGSEGMLGAVTRMKLALFPKSYEPWDIVFFFTDQHIAADFIKAIMNNYLKSDKIPDIVNFIEFFDKATLSLIAKYKKDMSYLKRVPDIPEKYESAVYIELDCADHKHTEVKLLELLELFEGFGGLENDTWAAAGSSETETFHLFRHAAPEAVNIQVDLSRCLYPQAYKMCIDITSPVGKLIEYLDMYRHDITEAALEGYVFGHAAESRFHINLIPKNESEKTRSILLFKNWSKKAIGDGGRILSENGIGKTKKAIFLENVFPDELRLLKQIKSFFDPEGLLNPENMF